ncbi:hypothetical protein RJ639_047715, partial [Escallonia herrerae]
MAFVHSLHLRAPLFPSHRRSLPLTSFRSFHKVPLNPSRNRLRTLATSSPNPRPTADQNILESVAGADDGDTALPAVRAYENDSARLSLVGAVGFEQALTAAAADGGEAAAEHVASGLAAMVVETVFPGGSDEHSTVSTRLFLPAKKVREKARRLKNILTKDMLSSTTSKNILAMTFRQVVLQQLWNFELVLFRPGTERKMEDLEDPREVPTSFILSSSDEQVISVLAEVFCLSAFESTEGDFLDNLSGRASNDLFRLFHKPKRISSKDSSVILDKFFEDEVIGNATSLLEEFNSKKAKYKTTVTKTKYNWWTSPAFSKLEKIAGPEFRDWVSEYIPAYRLHIDSDILDKVKLEGWKNSAENRWEVLLTHSQMVGLASIFDMYYEDLYTLPNKQLQCGALANSTKLPIRKRSVSWLKLLSTIIASGLFLVIISILRQLYLPQLHNGAKYPRENRSLQSSNIDCINHHPGESRKMEGFCISVVEKIKSSFGWPGEITKESGGGAWTGKLPEYLRLVESDSSNVDVSSVSAPSEKSDEEMKVTGQDIASYQVVLSADGDIVGFQPTSRVAVNHWAANPLAKELYGFIEPGLKISCPNEIAVVELLMSVNPDSYFALARP